MAEHTVEELERMLAEAKAKVSHVEYPKMLYSRTHHADRTVAPSYYDPRHDWAWVHVADEDQAKQLGEGWVENPVDLPLRGDIPLYPPVKADPAAEAAEDSITKTENTGV